MRISNLIVAASAASLVHAYPTRDIKKRGSGFTWVGVSESGAEFGSSLPGTLGTDYTWPDTSKIQTLRNDGMNVFRIPFLMERLAPNAITGSLDATYLKDLKSTVQAITDSGAYAVLDPHNYGRYSGSIITSTSDFKTFWKTVAGEFASNEKVIFDTNNEYHDMEQSLVLSLNQAAIDGIRAAGATTQYIFVEGNSYSGAWKWADTNDNLSQLTDPQDKIVYEMHQYLDSDGSGTSEACASATIGKERLQTATQWLKTNNKKGFLGEFAGGVNEQCEQAVEGLLSYMSDNSDVWMGAEWWSAGPWWGSYMYSIEPTDGTAYSTYLPILKKYFVDGTGASTSSSATSAVPTTAAASTSAPASVSTTSESSTTISTVESSSTSSVAEAPSTTTTSDVVTATPTPSHPAPQPTAQSSSTSSSVSTDSVPTTLSTSQACGYRTTVTVTASKSTAVPSSAASAVPQYYQCGGINYSGSTTCASGYTCVKQNPYYSQCL